MLLCLYFLRIEPEHEFVPYVFEVLQSVLRNVLLDLVCVFSL